MLERVLQRVMKLPFTGLPRVGSVAGPSGPPQIPSGADRSPMLVMASHGQHTWLRRRRMAAQRAPVARAEECQAKRSTTTDVSLTCGRGDEQHTEVRTASEVSLTFKRHRSGVTATHCHPSGRVASPQVSVWAWGWRAAARAGVTRAAALWALAARYVPILPAAGSVYAQHDSGSTSCLGSSWHLLAPQTC